MSSVHYGDPQIAIGLTFAVLALLLAAAFGVIAFSSRLGGWSAACPRFGYWLRKRWLALLLVIGVLVVGISLFDLPFATGSGAGRTVVKVTGGQFFWSLSPNRVPVGSHVRFDVTSVDVNHGFGLYDPHGHLIGSVQAMPGYDNELDLNLTEAGVYQIRCLELCGLNHSTMESTFRVTPSLMEAATSQPSGDLHPRAIAFTGAAQGIERRLGLLFAGTGFALVAGMGVLGLIMRLTQATVIRLSPGWFYRLLTLHGVGMITGALLAMMGALWYVLHATVPLSTGRMLTTYC